MDFDNPEATLLVEFPGGGVEIQVNSLLYRGRYWKLGRNISQAYWPTPEGPRYFSVEQALWPMLKLTGGGEACCPCGWKGGCGCEDAGQREANDSRGEEPPA
ncbi:hypothetical protein [Aeropyrum camini]|uniref:hypothetical protein n=1 Tax=Aeropyrum camini TaxID=229980 RepID=UPI000788BB35